VGIPSLYIWTPLVDKNGLCFLSTKRCRCYLLKDSSRRNNPDRSARRQGSVLLLITFLGRARKVTRLPAGTGELKVGDFVLAEVFNPLE
jgi:membrane protein DedA with SNARE-associated domain